MTASYVRPSGRNNAAAKSVLYMYEILSLQKLFLVNPVLLPMHCSCPLSMPNPACLELITQAIQCGGPYLLNNLEHAIQATITRPTCHFDTLKSCCEVARLRQYMYRRLGRLQSISADRGRCSAGTILSFEDNLPPNETEFPALFLETLTSTVIVIVALQSRSN